MRDIDEERHSMGKDPTEARRMACRALGIAEDADDQLLLNAAIDLHVETYMLTTTLARIARHDDPQAKEFDPKDLAQRALFRHSHSAHGQAHPPL